MGDIEVDIPYVEVHIPICDFKTSELVNELVRRIEVTNDNYSKFFYEKETKILIDALKRFKPELGFALPCTTQDDKMKIEFLASVWNKYNCFQLEEKLK